MVCGRGEYKNGSVSYIRQHLNRSAGSKLNVSLPCTTKTGVQDALIFNFCIVGASGLNKFLFICYRISFVVW